MKFHLTLGQHLQLLHQGLEFCFVLKVLWQDIEVVFVQQKSLIHLHRLWFQKALWNRTEQGLAHRLFK